MSDRHDLRANNPEAVQAHVMVRDEALTWHRLSGAVFGAGHLATLCDRYLRPVLSRETLRRGVVDTHGMRLCERCEEVLDAVLREAQERCQHLEY